MTHLKRQTAPVTWPIERKGTKFITRPNPGKSRKLSLPLNLIFKNLLNYCKTTKEVKKLLLENIVLVDGKRRKDHRYPVGLMDVLVIESTKESYRLSLNQEGKLELIPAKNTTVKPCRIMNKKVLKKGMVQLNFFDGTNLVVKKDSYKTNDTVMIDFSKKKVTDHIKFDKNSYVLLTGGKHIGYHGIISNIKDHLVEIEDSNKNKVLTDKRYAFAVGTETPQIEL